MSIRYDYQSMRETTEKLQSLVADFACAYKNTANNVEWDGAARQKFDEKVEQALATVVAMMEEVSAIPKNSANKMQEKDAEMAAKVRAAFGI